MQISSAEYSRAAAHANSIPGKKMILIKIHLYICPEYQAQLIRRMNLAGLINKC